MKILYLDLGMGAAGDMLTGALLALLPEAERGELLRRLKAEPQARFIKTVPFSLPPRYDPSAEDSRELAADRLLILSGFPQGTPDSRAHLRARCNIMNSLAAALCTKAAEMA